METNTPSPEIADGPDIENRTDESSGVTLGRAKKWAFYLVAVLAAVFMLVAFAEFLPYVVLGFTAAGAAELGIHRLHSMALMALFGAMTLGFVVQLYRPRVRAAPMVLAMLVASLLFVGIALDDPAGIGDVVPFLLFAVVLGLLHPAGRRLFSPGRNYSPALLGLVALALVPLALFAANQFTLQAIAGDEHAMEFHYAGMSILALTVVGGGIIAGLELTGYRIVAWMTGLLAAYLGVLSVSFPAQAGSVGPLWGALLILWGVAFVVVAELSRREGASNALRRPLRTAERVA